MSPEKETSPTAISLVTKIEVQISRPYEYNQGSIVSSPG